MSRFRVAGQQTSLWSRTGPNARLVFGAFVIIVIGFMGQTPKSVLGFDIIWPHAALLGAAGWGMAGLSLRPMLILIMLGLAQDIGLEAPLGCFVMVNLSAYGLSALAAENLELDNDPMLAVIVPAFVIAAGFIVLWIISSASANHPVTFRPLVGACVTTLGLWLVASRLFDLGLGQGRAA